MNTAKVPKHSAARIRGAACACALALAACGLGSSGAPPCRAEMPRAEEFLKDPAFATLEYRNRVNYEATRGAGYDLWGDSKFEYKAGLQFSLADRGAWRKGTAFDRAFRAG